jgi:uncharacterized metal-binding protein YceD (DUF177 family)
MSEPEFSRTVRADAVGTHPRPMRIEAGPGEREALARRFGLSSLPRLDAEVSIVRANEDILATGRVSAEAVQSCVVTDAPVPARIEEDFAIRFRPEQALHAEEEVELGDEELDVIFYDGALVDVGEAVAQTVALALEPYPRAPGAEDVLREAGVIGEAEAGPFGALAALKDKLK